MIPCSRCGEEVRWGWRHGRQAYWHRLDVDHEVTLGRKFPTNDADLARWRESYEARFADDQDDESEEAPDPEVRRTTIEPGDPRVPGGCTQVFNLISKHDWELRALTYARGPYVGSKGEVLSISDHVVLKGRRVMVDGSVRVAVASWRDGKFDGAYIGEIRNRKLSPVKVNATEMKDWIKTGVMKTMEQRIQEAVEAGIV